MIIIINSDDDDIHNQVSGAAQLRAHSLKVVTVNNQPPRCSLTLHILVKDGIYLSLSFTDTPVPVHDPVTAIILLVLFKSVHSLHIMFSLLLQSRSVSGHLYKIKDLES